MTVLSPILPDNRDRNFYGCQYLAQFLGSRECPVFIGRKTGKSEENSLQDVETDVYYVLQEEINTGLWNKPDSFILQIKYNTVLLNIC